MSASNFFIFLDSRNKTYGSNTDFSIFMNGFNLENGVNVQVTVDEVSFFNLQYPINSNNNTIIFQEAKDSGTDYTATLSVGSYTGSEMATEIASKMTAVTGNAYTYAGTYDSNTGKITISVTVPDTFTISSINEIFGINAYTTFASTKTSDMSVNLAGVEYVDICLPSLLSGNMTSNYNSNGIIKRIPMTVPWGSLMAYRAQQSDDSVVINKEYLDNIVVRVFNPDHTIYELPDNAHISIVLRCSRVL